MHSRRGLLDQRVTRVSSDGWVPERFDTSGNTLAGWHCWAIARGEYHAVLISDLPHRAVVDLAYRADETDDVGFIEQMLGPGRRDACKGRRHGTRCRRACRVPSRPHAAAGR